MQILINILLFQAGWFAAVIGAANGIEWMAIVTIAVIIVMHLLMMDQWRHELYILLAAGIIGTVLDSTLISQGVFAPVNPGSSLNVAPLWLIALWMLFAITINHSLGWLRRNLWLQPLAGFVFAPMAYYAGHKFDALNISGDTPPYISLLTIGICWMFIIPLLFRLADIINRRTSATTGHGSRL